MNTRNPLLLVQLDIGTRVRADGDIHYMVCELDVTDGTEGTVVQPWGTGASWVRWDTAPDEVIATSHDSLALVPS